MYGTLIVLVRACGRDSDPGDGDSMNEQKLCEPLGGDGSACIPGCSPLGQTCPEVGRDWSCSFPPSRLREALEHQQVTTPG